jgi:hypothetical protein
MITINQRAGVVKEAALFIFIYGGVTSTKYLSLCMTKLCSFTEIGKIL